MSQRGKRSVCIEIEIPFVDIDAQRIVWHGNYLRYFELARTRLLIEAGVIDAMKDGSWELVVSDSHCRHYRPLKFGERCTIHAWLEDVDYRLNVRYLIQKNGGEKVARGHTHLVTLDPEGKLQLVTPPGLLESISRWQSQAAVDDPGRRSFVVATAALLASGSFFSSREAQAASALPSYISKTLGAHQTTQGLKAKFVEKKYITFLKAPLLSNGELYYSQPGLFARTTEHPEKSKLVVRDDQIMFRQGTEKPQKISLKDRPELRSLVSGILLLFAGNEKKILELYETKPHGDSSAWRLELMPRDKSLQSMVKKLVVIGREAQLTSFEVHESSGDYSVTELKNLELGQDFSAEAKQRIFRI